MRSLLVISLALLGLIGTALPVMIQDAAAQDVATDDLDNIVAQQKAAAEREAQLKAEREKIQGDITGLNKELGSQIKTLSGLETDINKAQSRYETLEADYQAKRSALLAEQESLEKFLGYIQRLERRNYSPLVTSPSSAIKASQTSLLIKSLTREFDQKSQALKLQIEDISRLRETIVSEQADLERKQGRIKTEEQRLQNLVSQRREKAASIADEEKKARQDAARLAAKAEDLKQLLEALEEANKNITPRIKPRNSGGGPVPESSYTQNSGTQKFTQAKRGLLAPVKGRLIKKYGGGENGLTLSAVSRSDVKAPYNGRVEFAGAFKDYGNVVIINVGEGYFLLLTGLGNTIVDIGDKLSRGTIIGALPASRTGKAELYIELRKGSGSVDPSPWFNGFE